MRDFEVEDVGEGLMLRDQGRWGEGVDGADRIGSGRGLGDLNGQDQVKDRNGNEGRDCAVNGMDAHLPVGVRHGPSGSPGPGLDGGHGVFDLGSSPGFSEAHADSNDYNNGSNNHINPAQFSESNKLAKQPNSRPDQTSTRHPSRLTQPPAAQSQIAHTVITTSLPTSPPSLIRLVNILTTRRVVSPSALNSLIPSAPDRPVDLSSEKIPPKPPVEDSIAFPPDFQLVWIRETGTPCAGWMVDQFTAGIFVHPLDLPEIPSRQDDNADTPESGYPTHSAHADIAGTQPSTASRGKTVSPAVSTHALISTRYIYNLRRLLPFTHIHPPLNTHISNLFSAASAHPRLSSTFTAKALNSFPLYVKAHRLISAAIPLPTGWESALDRRDAQATNIVEKGRDGDKLDRFGVGGGRGGVHTWARAAGEEPDITELRSRIDRQDGAVAGVTGRTERNLAGGEPISYAGRPDNDPNGGKYGADTAAGEHDQQGEGWYAATENVDAVWNLCIRHRVRARPKRGDIMWLMAGGASDDVGPALEGGQMEKEADQIMEGILRAV